MPIIADWAGADEPAATRWFQAASPPTVRVRIVPHAGHTQGLATAPRAQEAHVISLLNMAPNPATTPVGQPEYATGGEDDLGPDSF